MSFVPTRAADVPVVALDRLDLAFEPQAWCFADERREDIDQHFARLRASKPDLWNGRVLLMHRHAIAGGVLSGAYLETDFASFIAWRDWDFPDRAIRNCFALAAVRGSDGGFLLGVMGAHTANAGRIYFPGGTPEPADVIGGRVDLEASVRRELAEETGLDASTMRAAPDWHAALAGPRISLVKLFDADEPATHLRDRVREHIACDTAAELSDLLIVGSPRDFTPAIQPFVTAFLLHEWAR